jgi:hypothetical protein
MERPWEIIEPKKPEPVKPSWDTLEWNSYNDYLTQIISLYKRGFKLDGGPLSLNDVERLTKLIDQGADVVRLPYFDGQYKVENLFETYVKQHDQ